MSTEMTGGIWRQVAEAVDGGGDVGVIELAQSQAQAAVGDAVGKIETTKGNAFVTRADGSKVKAEVGLDIFQGDVIETEGTGSIGITFADNSTFSLAEAGQMTIDEMIYDPGTQQGSGAFSVASGVFTFVSGQIAKTGVDAMAINTPTSTIGIRGTSLAAKIGSKKGDVFTLLEDQDAPAAAPAGPGDGLKGQAAAAVLLAQAGGPPPSGEIVITNDVGSQTLNQPNATSSVSSRFSSPTIPVILPLSVVNKVFGAAIVVVRQTISATDNGPTGNNQGDGSTSGGAPGGTETGANPEGQPDGDVIGLSTSDLGIGSLIYDAVNWDGTAGAANLVNNANATVIVLYGQAGTAANAAAAVTNGNATATNAVILFHDSANSNVLTMMHNAAADGTESTLANFTNATMPAESANFGGASAGMGNDNFELVS